MLVNLIPSDQLPWAQVMYPITAGGGQGGSFQTPGIKQECLSLDSFLMVLMNKFLLSWECLVIMQRQLLEKLEMKENGFF